VKASVVFATALLVAGTAVRPPAQDAIERHGADLRAHRSDDASRRALRAIADQPGTSIEAYERIRSLLRQFPALTKAEIARTGEPGQKLMVSGVIRDPRGNPISSAVLHVFQTDAQGHYTRERVMDEPHARLFDFIQTGADGRFEFTTIRPGGYPGRPDRQGEQWRIPSHVHFEIDAPGFAHRSFQMVFDDDERMTPYWHEWAKKGRHPVVHVTRGPDGGDRVVHDVTLQSAGPVPRQYP